MNKKVEDPKWWYYLARFLLCLTIAVFCVCVFSLLATKGFFGKDDFGYKLGYSFFFAFSFYASLGLTLTAIIGVVAGFLLKYTLKLYVLILLVSLLPLFFLDVFL